MANHRNRFPARRRFLKQSTALTATMVALPHLARATGQETPADPAQGTVPAQGTARAVENGAGKDPNAPQDPSRRHAARRTRETGR